MTATRRLTVGALIITAVLALLAVATLLSPQRAGAQATAPMRIRLRAAVLSLPLAHEHRDGYDRDLFDHWVDADSDSCNTREEVLISESLVPPRVGSGCRVLAGRWYNYYDGQTWTRPSDVDIDHVVALQESWDSGAWRWSAARREAFANDLGDSRSLMAVTDTVNASKGARDPSEWLPQPGTRCRYIGQWTAVKLRWGLSVDPSERHVLWYLSQRCRDVVIVYRAA